MNDKVVFMTAPPAGFTIGATYFVKTVVDANAIVIAATSGGTAITPTGSGSPGSPTPPHNLANLFTALHAVEGVAATFGVSGLTGS